MNEWKVILATALIFGAGVVTGGLLVNHVNHPHYNRPHSQPAGKNGATGNTSRTNGVSRTPFPEVVSKHFVDVLQTNLHLSAAQRAGIEKLIAKSQENMRKAFQEERHNDREKIHALLTPAQQKKFDEMIRQHAAKRAQQNATNSPAALKKTD